MSRHAPKVAVIGVTREDALDKLEEALRVWERLEQEDTARA